MIEIFLTKAEQTYIKYVLKSEKTDIDLEPLSLKSQYIWNIIYNKNKVILSKGVLFCGQVNEVAYSPASG